MLPKTFPFNRGACERALADPETPAVILYSIIVAAYKDELYPDEAGEDGIDPITLWYNLREDFKVDVDITAQNRINAIQIAVETDLFYLELEAFDSIISGIVHGSIDDALDGGYIESGVTEILTAIFEVGLIRGDQRPEFSDPIKEYIASELVKEVDDDDSGQETADAFLTIHRHNVTAWFKELGVDEQDLITI